MEKDSSGSMPRRSMIRTGTAAGLGAIGLAAVTARPASAEPAPLSSGLSQKTPPNWKLPGEQITFQPADFDVLDLTLHVVPELRICALAVKLAQETGVVYPITSHATIAGLLPGKKFSAAGHHITAAAISRYVPEEFFPINHPGELAERLYMALLRCRAESSALMARRSTPAGATPTSEQ
ncbi:hypothetical protein AB0K18_45475 [Nonomuraea sp. NPDC049421]|uniref:hypothetical protein n=1 Tax=Nonomuraea sp. NPDC049421 TaxID=3155275 RepID=UPI00343A5C08